MRVYCPQTIRAIRENVMPRPPLPQAHTKLVCTIGPASRHPATLQRMLRAGMSVARLNLAHGNADGHRETIARLREASRQTGYRLAILADLPGPKMRVGRLEPSPVTLARDQRVNLVEGATGGAEGIPYDFPGLVDAVNPGEIIYLNDGFIQLKVLSIKDRRIACRVQVGGTLLSHNGMNVPGIDLGKSAFTPRDEELLQMALEAGVDAVSVSFVQRGEDLRQVRQQARALGYDPFLIAKIERAMAVREIDDILAATDGIMVARGDLGVETPIESIAVTQKALIRRAKQFGRPVITATQMLESMVENRRPTRAEATDVANAILDGTDCVMLSEESAIGQFPVEAVRMLTRIALATEKARPPIEPIWLESGKRQTARVEELMAPDLADLVHKIRPPVVIAPTDSGATARRLACFKFPCRVIAFSSAQKTCQDLCFSYGVVPVQVDSTDVVWREVARSWCSGQGIRRGAVVMTHGPSKAHPQASNFVEIFNLQVAGES